MEPDSKNWAKEYLLDPLNEPEPSAETGPGTSFRPEASKSPTTTITPKAASVRSSSGSKLQKNTSSNPFRKSLGTPPASPNNVQRSSSLRSSPNAFPSPPPSASPNGHHSPSHRQEAFSSENTTTRRRRGSSLNERYPGDMSHRPLEQLSAEKRTADRSRHTTRKHYIQPDTIDGLDSTGARSYHHGGPYDATLFARNNSYNSPLNALSDSNAEALKATPHEKIVDSVQGHRPLDGVAAYAPGETDPNGQTYSYRQGENMMIENNPAGGAYKRWPGIQYHDDDIKGKGEPSYSIEKALKDHSLDEKKNGSVPPEEEGIELKTHKRESSGASATFMEGHGGWDDGETPRRMGSLSKGLKKRVGSLKRRMHGEEREPGRF